MEGSEHFVVMSGGAWSAGEQASYRRSGLKIPLSASVGCTVSPFPDTHPKDDFPLNIIHHYQVRRYIYSAPYLHQPSSISRHVAHDVESPLTPTTTSLYFAFFPAFLSLSLFA